MQSVTDRWYVIYARVAVGVACGLLALCVVAFFMPSFTPLQRGFSFITEVLCILTIAYHLLLYKRQSEQSGAFVATMVIALLQALNVINLVHATGQLHSWFIVLWYGVVLAAGMFGSYALLGSAFLVSAYFVVISTNSRGNPTFDVLSVAVLAGSWLLSVVSYLLWKPHYTNNLHSGKLNKLLKSKQLQSETLIEAINDGVMTFDTTGTILLMNPAVAEMVGWSVVDAVGINLSNVINLNTDKGQPLGDNDNPFKLVLKKKEALNQTVNLVSKGGTTRIISLVMSLVMQPDGKDVAAIVTVFHDVTEAHAQEQRSADFISTASHEMRTPVAAIEGYLALALNEHVAKIDPKARDYLEKAHASAQHLGQLFQDLLTSAKAEDGRLVSHPVVIEMGSYLEQLTDGLKFSAQKKGLLTDFTIGTSDSEGKKEAGKVIRPLYYTTADPDRMREVVTNLFDNAVKYTESGKVSFGLTGNDKVVQIFIRDTGNGIPKEDIPHLFQKFYRVDNSATRTIGGSGLGLFICRKIVELYNGRIWVDSVVGQGSTFYINLPRLNSAQAAALQQQAAAQPESILK